MPPKDVGFPDPLSGTPKASGKYYIQDGWIWGPKNGGKYWIQDDWIWGPKDGGKFWIADGWTYGPGAMELPWLDE
jgi:hypothetical protein